jgi:cell division protein FtsL
MKPTSDSKDGAAHRTVRISTLARDRVSKRKQKDESHHHGWKRAGDTISAGGSQMRKAMNELVRRRATGTPLLLCTILGVMTSVGLARVNSRVRVLDLAEQITELTDERNRLLDHKRRLQTERAYLRTPTRIRREASERLGMKPTPPERIQVIRVQQPKSDSPPPEGKGQ